MTNQSDYPQLVALSFLDVVEYVVIHCRVPAKPLISKKPANKYLRDTTLFVLQNTSALKHLALIFLKRLSTPPIRELIRGALRAS